MFSIVLRSINLPNTKQTIVHVNSNDGSSIFDIPAVGVHRVQSVSGYHPVLAWRDGDCVFLAGSSRILVRNFVVLHSLWLVRLRII